ncbi:MAG TPA: hypothetical protein VKV40_02315 [Ktedonobacteraceae bacterium]|nr:hypothetical protein [Ktedonobacteraceae bacterium]
MSQEKDQSLILILGSIRSDKQDFLSKLNSFSFLLVKDKQGRTLLNIPLWIVAAALVGFFALRAMRSR